MTGSSTDLSKTGELVFLKLGGSLITDKTQPSTPRLDVLERLAGEIAAAQRALPRLQLILGHGSGSFGHVPAQRHRTREGVSTRDEWLGFAEVWWQASALNRLVIESLRRADLPALSFPVSSAAFGVAGQFAGWDIAPLQAALEAGVLPVVYGDVVFDRQRGGTIFSTEDIFAFLAPRLHPGRILLAGLEEGVYAGFPEKRALIPEITPANFAQVAPEISGSTATDVTGGMASKVRQMLALVGELPGLQAAVFSGVQPGSVQQALLGEISGTRIHSQETVP